MKREKYIRELVSISNGELKNAQAASASQDDHAASLLNTTHGANKPSAKSFAVPNRPLEEIAHWTASNVTARRISSTRRLDRVEESIYWLISAATLEYLLLTLFGR